MPISSGLWECFSACGIFACYFSTLLSSSPHSQLQHEQMAARLAVAAAATVVIGIVNATNVNLKTPRAWKVFCASVQFAASSSLFVLICQVCTIFVQQHGLFYYT